MGLKERLVESIYVNPTLTRSDKIKLTKYVLSKEESILIESSLPKYNRNCRRLYKLNEDVNKYINCLEKSSN